MKGFILPTSNTTTNGSFSNLITQTSANANTIVQAPLMFVRGGAVRPGDALYGAGYEGNSWTSVTLGGYRAYNLYLNPYNAVPLHDSDQYIGFSLRCVALGG